jgi:sulfoxide reductase heme-binding subunit YedZ
MADPVRRGAVETVGPATGAGASMGGPPRDQSASASPTERHRPRPRRSNRARTLAHAALWVAAFVPLAILVFRFVTDDLGGEPIDAFEKETGTWALRFLAAALAVTPLRTLAKWSWLAPYRRTLGLVTFAYATVHLLAYAVLDMVGDLGDIGADIVKHPYVTFGMASWLLLLPLAITSTVRMQKRLGGVRWRRLHQLAYVVAGTATIHYLWSVKKDHTRPLIYALVFTVLLGARAVIAERRKRDAGLGKNGPEPLTASSQRPHDRVTHPVE